MKVTQVALLPTESSRAEGRPALTPELLAATGARYSRNNEGLEAILSKIDPNNLDKSVDSIFRMIDYGHQSIADMAPVAMFIDDISMWLAYFVWSVCPTAGGQESSTRYIRLSPEGLIEPKYVSQDEVTTDRWRATMAQSFDAYHQALNYWEGLVRDDPLLARVPSELLEDTSDKAKKQVARMLRNYAFDRARYFLPLAVKTNMMLVMSARAWVQLCQNLLSHQVTESNELGALVADELNLVAPRLLKHATKRESFEAGLKREFEETREISRAVPVTGVADDTAYLEVFPASNERFVQDIGGRENRYGYLGMDLRRTAVRFGWNAVAIAEIRDLNRHRTGTKFCPLAPVGFYAALDQTDTPSPSLSKLYQAGTETTQSARKLLIDGDPSYVYWTLLGTQYPFEHTTTADKYIYEAELRTGTGAHYRYAKHLRESLNIWYERYPETRGMVQEGKAEPE